jgi:3'(2'), 5'-bisphosphate nucleotidase
MIDLRNPAPVLADLCAIAQAAGEAILDVYGSEFSVQMKDDRSPLTEADRVAHRIIGERLRALDETVPMLSEESAPQDIAQRRSWTRYWLVDPLDGTKEFLKRNGEFTVNIALVDAGRAVLGVVLAPVLARLYYGAVGHGAWRTNEGGEAQPIRVSKNAAAPLRIVGSRSHGDGELADYVAALGAHELKPMGSSLKICLIAEGSADIYPRLGPTSEWDTAAAQAILESAGGRMIDRLGEPLRYNTKDDLLNPHFLAFGDTRRDWLAPIRSTRQATRGPENRH